MSPPDALDVYVAPTQRQAEAFITLDAEPADAVWDQVMTRPVDALR